MIQKDLRLKKLILKNNIKLRVMILRNIFNI